MRHRNELVVTLGFMQLYSQSYPENPAEHQPESGPILIIPGLFGSTSNWRGFARAVAEHHPVIVVDQRNHGRSAHADSHSYHDMVADLMGFLDEHDLQRVVLCGHSMGGKAAMVFALLHPERVSQLAVLDIAPVEYTHSHAPFLEEMMALDMCTLNSRSEADRALQAAIPDTGTRLFLLQSLTGSPGNYHWRLNLEVLHRYMSDIVGFPADELLDKVSDVATAVIYGEGSDYVRPEHHQLMKNYFPNAYFEGIEGAGHWLHVEQPKPVVNALLEFVRNGEKNV